MSESTNPLTQVREDLREILDGISEELQAFTVVPEEGDPPMVWVAPGSPYVTREEANLGAEIVRCNAVILASTGDNDISAEELDGLILQVKDAIDDSEEFWAGDVGLPGTAPFAGQSYLAVSVEAQTEIRREDS